MAFDGAQLPEPIIVQHMLAGVNAHIDLDLGIAAEQIAPGASCRRCSDFNTVNAVLGSQVNGVADEIDELSPVLADIYDVCMKNEIDLIGDGAMVFRDSAWRFARCWPPSRDSHTADDHGQRPRGREVRHADPLSAPLLASIVAVIASRESRDVVHNIRVLDAIASTPAPIRTTM